MLAQKLVKLLSKTVAFAKWFIHNNKIYEKNQNKFYLCYKFKLWRSKCSNSRSFDECKLCNSKIIPTFIWISTKKHLPLWLTDEKKWIIFKQNIKISGRIGLADVYVFIISSVWLSIDKRLKTGLSVKVEKVYLIPQNYLYFIRVPVKKDKL